MKHVTVHMKCDSKIQQKFRANTIINFNYRNFTGSELCLIRSYAQWHRITATKVNTLKGRISHFQSNPNALERLKFLHHNGELKQIGIVISQQQGTK